MAASPTVKFEHIWHALFRVIFQSHRSLWHRNQAIQNDMANLMRR